MDRHFGGVIWTNHVLERLKERGISQSDAWVTWRRPTKSGHARHKGAWVYYRTIGSQKLEVVAKKNERGEWVILSVWSRPIKVGTKSSSAHHGQPFLVRLLGKLGSLIRSFLIR
jgi:hypothetical protein